MLQKRLHFLISTRLGCFFGIRHLLLSCSGQIFELWNKPLILIVTVAFSRPAKITTHCKKIQVEDMTRRFDSVRSDQFTSRVGQRHDGQGARVGEIETERLFQFGCKAYRARRFLIIWNGNDLSYYCRFTRVLVGSRFSNTCPDLKATFAVSIQVGEILDCRNCVCRSFQIGYYGPHGIVIGRYLHRSTGCISRWAAAAHDGSSVVLVGASRFVGKPCFQLSSRELCLGTLACY